MEGDICKLKLFWFLDKVIPVLLKKEEQYMFTMHGWPKHILRARKTPSREERWEEFVPCSGTVTFCPIFPGTVAVVMVSTVWPGETDIFSAAMLDAGEIVNFVPSVRIFSICISLGLSSPKSLLFALPAVGEL